MTGSSEPATELAAGVESSPPLSDAARRLGRAGPNAGEIELLRAATLVGEPAAAAWRRWIAASDVYVAHHRSTDLLPAVAANLPATVLGDEAARLSGIRRRVWVENTFGLRALRDAAVRLRAIGIEPIIAKGASLATTVFDAAGTRVMHDVDLIVGPERIDDAVAELLGAGWRRVDPVEGPFFHAVALEDPTGRSVDLHRWIVFPRFTPVPERSWLERAVPHEILATPVRRLTSADELVLSLLHGMLTNSDSASRWPIDVVMLARDAAARTDGGAGFWSLVVESSRELEVGPVVADGLDFCATDLAAPVPADVLAELRQAPVDGALARHWWLCRRGITPEWRIRRYVRLARSEGRRASVAGYVGPRVEALRTRGMRSVFDGRFERARKIIDDRTRV